MRTLLIAALRRTPILGAKLRALQSMQAALWMPPGHFYSPIPSLDEVRRDATRLFAPPPRSLPGIELREAEQIELFHKLKVFYQDQPFQAEPTAGLRYFFNNPSYSYSDAIVLHGMLRHLRPRRIVEIGSGNSSAVILDTNERFLGGRASCTFIEPHPEVLLARLRPSERDRIELLQSRLQDVELKRFEALQANDVLFVDSTHVAKTGSDVNRLFFEILPCLQPGVFIHFHDVFYPFEYPRPWVEEGRAWNEAYMLRTFLQYNRAFRIEFFNTFLAHFHEGLFAEAMPLCLKDRGGSLWMQKVATN